MYKQHVEEEGSECNSDLEVVNKPTVISLNLAREKIRDLIMLFEFHIDFRQNQAHRVHWVEQLAMLGKVQNQITMYKEPLSETQPEITNFFSA